jgi:hypothetical protein
MHACWHFFAFTSKDMVQGLGGAATHGIAHASRQRNYQGFLGFPRI